MYTLTDQKVFALWPSHTQVTSSLHHQRNQSLHHVQVIVNIDVQMFLPKEAWFEYKTNSTSVCVCVCVCVCACSVSNPSLVYS